MIVLESDPCCREQVERPGPSERSGAFVPSEHRRTSCTPPYTSSVHIACTLLDSPRQRCLLQMKIRSFCHFFLFISDIIKNIKQ
jgi:hypothetical protein